MTIVIQFIGLCNLVLFFTGNYALYKKVFPDDSRGMSGLVSFILSLVIISFCHYLILIFYLSFWADLLAMTFYNTLRFFLPDNRRLAIKFPSFKLRNLSVAACVGLFILTLLFVFDVSKYGGSDAWGIWNAHARFLYYPEFWTSLSAPGKYINHADYPLMIPSLVAFGWHCINGFSFVIPLLLTYSIYLCIAFMIYKTLKDKGLPIFGGVAFLVFIADTNFRQIATAQEADTMLALLILLTFILYIETTNGSLNKTYLLGFICGSCGWVKNEGLAFYLIFALAFLIVNSRDFKNIIRFVSGSLIPLAIIFSFKLFFATANDIVGANLGVSPLHKLTDIGRYTIIFKAYTNMLITGYPYILALAVIMLLKPGKKVSLPIIVIILLMMVYFIVYLVTPHDLQWHLYTSLSRLFGHIYPAFIYLAFLSLKDIPLMNKLLIKISAESR